jgi:hypothetical protein
MLFLLCEVQKKMETTINMLDLPSWLMAYDFKDIQFAFGLFDYVLTQFPGFKLVFFTINEKDWSIACTLEEVQGKATDIIRMQIKSNFSGN